MEQEQLGKKRQRTENWSEEDKIILMDLVRERVVVLENKNTDTNTNSRKVAAWNELRERFNLICSGPKRSTGQLKGQWGLLKMKVKKQKATERRELHRTGGGPPHTMPTVAGADLCSWLPGEFVVDSNQFDSDNVNRITVLSPPKPGKAVTSCDPSAKEEITVVELLQAPLPLYQGLAGPSGIGEVVVEGNKEASDQPVPFVESPSSIHQPPLARTTPKKGITKKKKFPDTSTHSNKTEAKLIAENEIACRKALHAAQLKNEEQKNINLILKEKLLKKKIELIDAKLKIAKNYFLYFI